MGIKIQPISKEHKADWKRLWEGYLSFYESSVEDAVYETTFERLLSKGEYEPRGFIATKNDTPVGLVHYLFHRDCWQQSNVCYLQDLFAVPSSRGTGVGRALIEAVYKAADEAGCPSVYWLTASDNAQAMQLYDRIAQKTQFVQYERK